MFSENRFIDERVFLIVIAVGTLIIYLVTPTPNILYREEADPNSKNIINFGENTACYGVKTTEVECPLESESESNSPLEKNVENVVNEKNHEDIPHNLNMNITTVDNKVIQ